MVGVVALAVWGNAESPVAVMVAVAAGRQFFVLLAVSFMVMAVMVAVAVVAIVQIIIPTTVRAAAVVGMGIIASVP